MRSLLRTVFLAVPSTTLAILLMTPVMPVTGFASPSPRPVSLTPTSRYVHTTVQATQGKVSKRMEIRKAPKHMIPRLMSIANHTSPVGKGPVVNHTHPINKHSVSKHASPAKSVTYDRTAPSASTRPIYRDEDATLLVLLVQLTTYRDGVVSNSQGLHDLASRSASASGNSSYQQQAASQLTRFHTSLQGFDNIFGQLDANKGLANYDKSNQLETDLKDVVNANKNALSDLTVMTYNVPELGPILGPILYEIKCILDGILDILENSIDGIWNNDDLESLLGGIIGQTTTVLCGLGLGINIGPCS